MVKRVAFDALIKRVEVKSLNSGDRAASILLYIDSPDTKALQTLLELHRADRNVFIVVMDKPETA